MNNNDNNNNNNNIIIIIINNNNNNNNNNNKLNRVLKENRGTMQDIGLHWNQKKCSVVQVKRGAQVLDESGMRMDETTNITALGEGKHYKFLGVLENVRQDERLALACAAKEYLRRISVIWSSPLSDCNRVQATNQYALPVLRYLMWTQYWSLSELRGVNRAARKIIVENGGKHPSQPNVFVISTEGERE